MVVVVVVVVVMTTQDEGRESEVQVKLGESLTGVLVSAWEGQY